MTNEESEAVKLTEKLVRGAQHPAIALIQRGHKIVSQGCNMFRCCRCGGHFDGRGDWSQYCQSKPEPYDCKLCGQRIVDGKPCGCGAR